MTQLGDCQQASSGLISVRKQCTLLLGAAVHPAHYLVCGHLHPGTCEHSRFALVATRPAQPLALLKAALDHEISLNGSFLAHCRLNPYSGEANHLILGEPRFQELQGRHLRHLSGLHWVPASLAWSHIDSMATLASFPNLESLEFHPGPHVLENGAERSEQRLLSLPLRCS